MGDKIASLAHMLRAFSQYRLVCFLLVSISLLAAADPPWYHQPQFLSIFAGYFFPRDPLLPRVPYSGAAWGLFLPPDGFSDTGIVEYEIAKWRAAASGPYFASVNLGFLNHSSPPEWDSFRMRTLDGQYLNEGGVATYSISGSAHQSYLRALAVRAVDIGADGLLIDDVQTQIAVIFGLGSQSYAGSFDTVTMTAFTAWLAKKYSTDQLNSQFGISDIRSFDYGNYIRSNGLAGTWNSFPLKGLSQEFFIFRRQETLQFLRDLVSSTKEYARRVYNRDFLFSTNAAFDEMAVFARDVMDLSTNEALYIKGQELPFMAPYIKAWKGWKGPSLVLPETGVKRPSANLERIIIADIQAAGGMPGATTQMNVGLGDPQTIDLSVVRRYANFVLNNPQLMSQTTTPSQIALVESAPSVIGGNDHLRIQSPAEANSLNGLFGYLGTARLLLDSGLTYDSVFFPDNTYSTWPSPGAQDLARYNVVIVASVWALGDSQVQALLDYAGQGGTLIVIGSFANSQPDNSAANRPQLQALIGAAGVTTYGSGRIVVAKELFGVEYQNSDRQVQRNARAAFQSFMAPYVIPDVQISGIMAMIHEPGITPFFYRDRYGNALVHLVNYDYDDVSDEFYSKSNVTLRVRVGDQPVDEVILRNPDSQGVQSLPFTRDGEFVSVTVSQVEAWVVLSFQPNQSAPVITSASPAAALGAVGNSALSFSVQAQDPDGNALTYVWSVNGQVVIEASGPTYSLQLPADASGIYTVTVAVTDGSRITEMSWSINVAARRRPRVLFDETHTETLTLSVERAQQLYPNDPTFGLASILGKALAVNYQLTDFTSGTLTPQVLAGADVLILAAPHTALTDSENQAVSDFVQSGGGLIYLGAPISLNGPTSINPLLKPWGIQFDNALIESPANSDCPFCFAVISFGDHPSVGFQPNFKVNAAGSFSVSPPAVGIGQTTDAEWKSSSGQSARQPGDPSGPFWMMAASQPGKGRVFAISDYTLNDDTLKSYTENLNLFLAAVDWTSANVNPVPVFPVLPATAIFSVVSGASFTGTVSSGSWATVKGQNLANTLPTGRIWTGADFNGQFLPTALDGTSVRINGRLAPVEFVSPGQLNFLVPDDTSQGTVGIQVRSPYGLATGTATLRRLAPALFPIGIGNVTYAAAVGLDGALIAPPGQILGARAAQPGETLQLFGTGFGETSPHQPANLLVNPSTLVNNVTAIICGQSANVTYGGLVSPGLNQINVTVPALPAGNCSLQLFAAGIGTQGGIVLPIGK